MKKCTAALCRFVIKEKFTLGRLKIFNESGNLLFECYTLELPYINNEKNISSIPANDYVCKLIVSRKFGIVFQVLNVVNRGNILIHKGNYTTDTHGCILLGSSYTLSPDKKECSLQKSKIAFDNLMSLGLVDFNLKISNLCL